MSYTKEEVSAIKANLKQIEEYAKENYAPRLRKDEAVSVEFGEPDPRRLRYSMDKDLSFGVNYSGDVWFRTGGLTLHFNPPEWCADRSIYDSWPYRMAEQGKLPSFRVGRRVLISREHLIDWMDRELAGHIGPNH